MPKPYSQLNQNFYMSGPGTDTLKKKKYVQVIQVDNEDWEPLCRGGARDRRRETLTHFLTELCTKMGFLTSKQVNQNEYCY